MSRFLLTALCLVPLSAAAQAGPLRLRLDTGEAEAALAILDARAGGAVPDSLWTRLEATEGFTRLVAREQSLRRTLSLDDMRAYLGNDSIVARRQQFRRTLEAWRQLPVADAGARALAYLPAGTTLDATIYLLVKPRTNSFVFDVRGRPAIMLYLDPDVAAPAFANTVAHELHHIGLGAACRVAPDTLFADTTQAAAAAREWLSAFGEGLAMLAAAGGPTVHPHQTSPAADRERWDRDMADAPDQMREVERFFLGVLDGKITGDSVTVAGMEFFGVQGPWYTVGYRMWSTVERRFGRARVVADACQPARLLLDYNQAVAGTPSAPHWSADFSQRLAALLAQRP